MSYQKDKGQLNKPIPKGPGPQRPIPKEWANQQEEPEAIMIKAKLLADNEDVVKAVATIEKLSN